MAVEPTTVHIPASARLCFELMDAEANPQHKQVLFELDQDPEVMRYVTGGKVTSMQRLGSVDVSSLFLQRFEDALYKAEALIGSCAT